MLRLVLLLSFVALSLSCATTAPAAGGSGGSSGGSSGGGAASKGGASKKKRDVHEAEVVAVTYQNYDPNMTNSYMGVIKSAVEQHAQEEGLVTNQNLIEERPGNVDGKFAVTYAVVGVECDQLKNFIMGAKEKSPIIHSVTVSCDGKETIL
ncbi:hypothetical protein TELCIR_02819 [Teladorsagia circumcincta]|uniref:Uncharacterized protein n=1 Tax=Teladorsagia circumcincta TaxID=45464 RepID=A0A2G9UY22_TELCI|nr:hypothetical protein TELCIR_02819 [Teladorsagia circumcincta]